MNPLPHQRRPRPSLEAGPRRKYTLTTEDHDEGGRVVKVAEEVHKKVVWSKTRELVEDEIVDTVRDSLLNPRWTIHRPITGWYLTLRSPSLPPNSFISFKPSTTLSPDNFNFTIRSVLSFPPNSDPDQSEQEDKDPSVRLDLSQPTSPSTPLTSTSPSTGDQIQKSHFRLQPHLPKHTHRQSSNPLSISSFTGLFADRGKTFSCVWEDENEAEVMRFEEEVGLLRMSTKGALYLNENVVNVLGMEPSFWAAVALSYLEFLQEQEGYHAANLDIM